MKKSIPVLDMSCAACAASVESIVGAQEGVHQAHVNYANHSLFVDFDESVVSDEELRQAVQSAGYDLVIEKDANAAEQQAEALRHSKFHTLRLNTILAGIFAVPVAVLGMFFMKLPNVEWIMLILTAPIVLWFGRQFFVNAWKQARHRSVNMDTLVAISTGLAFLFSAFNTFYPAFFESHGLEAHVYYEAAAVVIFFILLGRLLEEQARTQTSNAIQKLIQLQPSEAIVVKEGQTISLPLEAIGPGERLLIRPGERIPLDGKVLKGSSYVDESMISGEPLPLVKTEQDSLFAGTLNKDGVLEMISEKTGKDTLLAQIVEAVKTAQGSKAPVQRLVDRIASVFVPIVLAIAAITFLAWFFGSPEDSLARALLTSLTVLVIACPCALGLATPTAIIAGVGKGAENGILIKNAESLEEASKLDILVVDKTGTITTGNPAVINEFWSPGANENHRELLSALSRQSTHPLSKAIHGFLERKGNFVFSAFENIGGKGIEARYKEHSYRIGNLSFLKESGVDILAEYAERTENWETEGSSIVAFSEDNHVLALFGLQDEIRASSQSAVQGLQKRGVEIHMLTGDHAKSAQKVAESVGIKTVNANCKPSDKRKYIEQLQNEGKIVGMAGDGINDSEALARANLGIAMADGSDIALESADITLLHSDLNQVKKALNLSRKTLQTIRQNLFWAFIYNLIGIPLAAGLLFFINGQFLHPMIAGAAMAFSSVSVVANSLRLRRARV